MALLRYGKSYYLSSIFFEVEILLVVYEQFLSFG